MLLFMAVLDMHRYKYRFVPIKLRGYSYPPTLTDYSIWSTEEILIQLATI